VLPIANFQNTVRLERKLYSELVITLSRIMIKMINSEDYSCAFRHSIVVEPET